MSDKPVPESEKERRTELEGTDSEDNEQEPLSAYREVTKFWED